MQLSSQKCVPCEGGVPPMSEEEALKKLDEYEQQIRGWYLEHVKVKGQQALALQKQFLFKKSQDGADFVSALWKAAEKQGHHPDITLSYKRATVTWTTHAIAGLSINDFIMAATAEKIYKEFS